MWNAACMSFSLCPLLAMGAIDAIERHAKRRAESALSPAHRLRRMDRDDEPDGAAGRLRSRRADDARGAARRRHLSPLRPEDLHHLRRARPRRKHHPPRAGAASRCAGRLARHLALPRAESSGRCRRQARRAKRRLLLRHRAQARHPRLADLHDDLRRRPLRQRSPARSPGSSARRIAGSPACSR